MTYAFADTHSADYERSEFRGSCGFAAGRTSRYAKAWPLVGELQRRVCCGAVGGRAQRRSSAMWSGQLASSAGCAGQAAVLGELARLVRR
jgi:hypothetical protein